MLRSICHTALRHLVLLSLVAPLCRSAPPSLAFLAADAVPAGAPTVQLSNGLVFGTPLPASGGVPVNQFLGIPFGEPTNRWEPPVDLTSGLPSSPFNATMWGDACMQVLTENTTYGSEDCLRLNVWQPATAANSTSELKPVMVFVYGGSNQFGEAEPYNMSGLSAFHDVVCVNLNYRTGPIGYMAFEADVQANRSTGNFAVLDIQSALRWVHREIAHFGGDPTRVAIHGQSSGAALVELTAIISPASNGLIRGVVSESGGLSARSLKSALENTGSLATAAGCKPNGSTPQQVKECMVALPALNITSMTYAGSWGPTIDGVTVPRSPVEMLAAGHVNDLDGVAFGAQTNDSFLFLSRDYTKDGYSQPNDAPDGHLRHIGKLEYVALLFAAIGANKPISALEKALKLYPPTEHASIQNVQSLGRVSSDRGLCENRQRARALSNASKTRGYVYRFDYWYQSNHNCSAVPNFHLPYLGAVHQDEVTFVMGQPNFMEQGSCCGKWGLSEGAESCPQTPSCVDCYDEKLGDGYHAYFDDKEFQFARHVGDLWTSFARTGGPPNETWPDIDATGKSGIVLDANLENGSQIEQSLYDNAEVCGFWDSL